MKAKKTSKANLEGIRGIFFQVGLIFSLILSILAFEWKSIEQKPVLISGPGDKFKDADIINTFVKIEKPAPPKPEVFDLVILDDQSDFISEVINIKPEISQGAEVEFKPIMKIRDEDYDPIPFTAVEEKPSFPKGDFIKYIQENIRYPEEAIEMRIKGRISATFIVDKDGYIRDVKIIKGIDPMLDSEVVKVLKSSPRWNPGKQRGIPVKVAYSIPLNFNFDE